MKNEKIVVGATGTKTYKLLGEFWYSIKVKIIEISGSIKIRTLEVKHIRKKPGEIMFVDGGFFEKDFVWD